MPANFPFMRLAALLVVLLAAATGARAGVPELPNDGAPPPLVRQVTFLGIDNLPMSTVREALETAPPAKLRPNKLIPYDPATVRRDRNRLLALYKENGYFDASVQVKVTRDEVSAPTVEESTQLPAAGGAEAPRARSTVSIVFEVHEQSPYRISKLDLRVTGSPDNECWHEELAAALPIKVGQDFKLKEYQDAKAALKRVLSEQAHPLGAVEGQARVYKGKGKVVVVLAVKTGPRVLFGRTSVQGNRRVGEAYILQSKTYFRGQPYDQRQLEETQRRLMNTGFFSSVTMQPKFAEMQGDMVPMTIRIYERQPYSIRLGLGYGTEDLMRVRILQVNRNLLGLGDTLTFEGKISAIYEGVVGRLRLPHVFNLRSNLLVSGGLEQMETEAYINGRTFVTPTIEYRLDKRWTVYLGYNVERNRLRDLKTQVPDPDYENQTFFISSVPGGITYDSRNSVLDPTKGTYFNLEVETATSAIGSELEYIRPVARLSHVLPLKPLIGLEHWYLAGRAMAGIAYPLPGTDRIPLIKRFFPGGPNSVRGYPYQRLGPLDDGGKPLGGEAAMEGSIELRFPLVGELGGVLFMDAGDAYEDLSSDMTKLRFTSGAGLRYHTPVGPLRLDFGYQLNPPAGDPFTRWEVYLSVGQAF